MAEIIELDTGAGTHISNVCKQAAEMTEKRQKAVHFVFNGTNVTAQPGESAETLEKRWSADYEAAAEAWRNSPECKTQEEKRAEDARIASELVMVETAVDEEGMREANVPWPLTEKQLAEYIKSLVERHHDYGTCVYAMSMAAVAAFYYVAHCLGVTGFQSSCADLDILRRTRSLKGPFMLIKGEDALYPQSDLREKLDEALESWKPWLKEQAEAKLRDGGTAHPDVIEHWKKLAR